ncbi:MULTISPECIES: type II secretion system minor pseudopilin GspJ [Acinetobacter]|uniref:Type II secretion system protein J n=1 Tax=Acinetobacter baylyi (strain ATCC 33305 / BD413 / ADP1) TaxID=62977 RepID=Q6F9X9_ACIAD|nr:MULTISPECIES: type II secretion system minor pseudopilin GspJ [Acinetobacter]ENV54072.1 type II secretion system protein J [Acinetobacter baylyi DSM 14961 = CIP 107474]KAF2372991.1 type II secretion system protein GspJ [Acinetobacter baylyi]KAF2375415.1 type II secretion system protein GspJ [Acinetobacter baylyi]KAF2376095.1 type II secretion system protein GspJ [Acinetobacter baylyi]KAF2382844.1 type II secretion system protein GspJ [Acinetobacter baylyi]
MKRHLGFTLIELLVSIAIFAILSALGWKIFDYLIKIKDRNQVYEQQLFELQDAYQLLLRDSLQIIPNTANINGQLRPALSLSENILQFSRGGVSDPLKEGLAPYERIEYRYVASEKVVYRLKYKNLNVVSSEQPVSSVVLKNVDQFQIAVLNPQLSTQWPDPQIDLTQSQNLRILPRGLKVNLNIAGTEYEWIFPLMDTQFLSGVQNN